MHIKKVFQPVIWESEDKWYTAYLIFNISTLNIKYLVRVKEEENF